MVEIPFTPPTLDTTSFNCPYCGAYAHQNWWNVFYRRWNQFEALPTMQLSQCDHCDEFAYWFEGRLLIPDLRTAPPPNPDLEDAIKRVYEEAAEIASKSPRAAAALLRLCVQMLCIQLGEAGENINRDIKNLVVKGLPLEIQQALDVVRVVGNHAVHPGEINVDDQPETVSALFMLLNAIADRMITQPKKIAALYEELPPSVREAIAARDKK